MSTEERRGYERGSAWMRREYLVWRQILAFFDLAGEDGKPSITKLASLAVLAVGLYIAARTLSAPAGVVTMVGMGMAALFGRRTFLKYVGRNGNGSGNGSGNGNGHTTEMPAAETRGAERPSGFTDNAPYER